MRIHFCTFAGGSTKYREAAFRLTQEAAASKYFTDIHVFTDQNLPCKIKQQFEIKSNILSNRGLGFWFWKPLIVNHVLDRMEDGDILFYLDSGCQISQYGRKRFNEYLDIINNNTFLFFNMPQHVEINFTAEKIVNRLKVNNKNLWTPQVQATLFGLKKCNTSLNLMNKWLNICNEDGMYYINDEDLIPLTKSFIDYRHDQSVLSLLVKENEIHTYPYECHHKSIDYYPSSKILMFPFHSVRNGTGITKDRHCFIKSKNYIIYSESLICIIVKNIYKYIYLIPKLKRYVRNKFLKYTLI